MENNTNSKFSAADMKEAESGKSYAHELGDILVIVQYFSRFGGDIIDVFNKAYFGNWVDIVPKIRRDFPSLGFLDDDMKVTSYKFYENLYEKNELDTPTIDIQKEFSDADFKLRII